LEKYIENFKRDATAFLTEWAVQMPKGSFARPGGKDGKGKDVLASEVAGIVPSKFVGGLACKAGLWWAKKEKKPVYYCLDGIDMEDVVNYKKVKNKAIEDFIAKGGKEAGADGHDEVITMVELREILKNWDELKGTVKFVRKGKMVTGDELNKDVAEWQEKMKKANKEAGRAPAPPRAKFASELNAIDPGLMAKLDVFEGGDMDARDIVKKSGYLVKVAKTRPEIVLKYIMSRCEVLTRYGLLSAGLAEAAAKILSARRGDDTRASSQRLLNEIHLCNVKFQAPLEAALIRHPLIARGQWF
jgi:hypothetical protein